MSDALNSRPIRADLPPLPARLAHLPIDARGFPVPYFVAWVDGKPDHRVVEPARRVKAVKERRCWVCGEPLGRFGAFVLGPMCAVTRTTSEPAAHRECAEYSVQACPFLSRPHAHRRDAGLPEDTREAPGVAILRNPGVGAIWTCHEWTPFNVPRERGGGFLLHLGQPDGLSWWREGRPATFGEMAESILSGLPLLCAGDPLLRAGDAQALASMRAALMEFTAALCCTYTGTDAGVVQFHEFMRDAIAIAESSLARQAEVAP